MSILRRDFPGLHRLIERRWLQGLTRAIREDLGQMHADGSRPASIERELEYGLPVAAPNDVAPIGLRVRGKLDRIDRLAENGLRVLDFKTGAKPERSTDGTSLLRGKNMQLLLYAMLLRADTDRTPEELEIRSLRPSGVAGAEPPRYRHELENAGSYLAGESAVGVQETLAVLGRLLQRGLFLPNPGFHCSWCDFRPACRRYHPPSAARVESCDAGESRDYAGLAAKTVKHPLLVGGEGADSSTDRARDEHSVGNATAGKREARP